MEARLDHVAVLVPSIAACRERLTALDLPVGEVESFPGEGTRELYAGPLLLIEAAGEGPYRRALAKRGPGLHHVGVQVPDVEAWVEGLAGSGWYLLPASLASLRASRTVWLARPGVPCLIEASEGACAPPGPHVGAEVASPYVSVLHVPGLIAGNAQRLVVVDRWMAIDALWA